MRPVLRNASNWAVLVAAIGIAAAPASAAKAGEASAWDKDMRSAARLIAAAASNPSGATLRAGIEIRLDRGWKTYWRYPGDSGIPPRFDFSRSENVRSVTVLWPAPERFDDGGGGNAIGYIGEVVLPLRIEREDSSRPATLRLQMDYGVCETLCVPAKAAMELRLSGQGGKHAARLIQAEARVPRTAKIGPGPAPAIVAVRREAGDGKERAPGTAPARIVVDVAAPKGAPVDLFAEGPTPQWALPLPAPVDGAPDGIRRFAFDLDGLPPDTAADGATLRLTAVVGNRAMEATFRID